MPRDISWTLPRGCVVTLRNCPSITSALMSPWLWKTRFVCGNNVRCGFLSGVEMQAHVGWDGPGVVAAQGLCRSRDLSIKLKISFIRGDTYRKLWLSGMYWEYIYIYIYICVCVCDNSGAMPLLKSKLSPHMSGHCIGWSRWTGREREWKKTVIWTGNGNILN